MIRVLIVEDQAILRESLARSVGDQPDMTVVSAIADASEALGVALKDCKINKNRFKKKDGANFNRFNKLLNI